MQPARRLSLPKQGPVCPVCQTSVFPGEHVSFGHGELTHLRCQQLRKDDVASLAAFLDAKPQRPYCGRCRGERLGMTYQEAYKVIGVLKMSERFKVAPAECVVCGNPRVTVQARWISRSAS